jgi:hypothetical protein
VFSSLPIAIKWLRDTVQQNQSIRFQVMPFLVGEYYMFGVKKPVWQISIFLSGTYSRFLTTIVAVVE